MTDRLIDPVTDETATVTEELADGPADDRAQHASADVAPELFGW